MRIVLFILLLGGTTYAFGQHAYEQKSLGSTVSVRQIEFMVRNGDHIKDIAANTKVPLRDILRLNKIRSKHYLAYPGLRLIIPVQVQAKVWDPTKEDMTGYSPSREDRGESDNDYEIIIDSTNYRLAEYFIDLSAARYDSIEYSNIGTHIHRIDKHIKYLYHKLDSVKQTDFKFDYEDQDKNSILGKMKLSRDKYYAEGPIGKQIDSLKEEKTYLGQRLIVLRNQIAEYEYLSDNASYSAAHYKEEEIHKPSNWGDHLAYESMYMKNKAESDQARANATSVDTAQKTITPPADHANHTAAKTDTAPPATTVVKTESITPKQINTDIETSTPKVATATPPAPTETAAPKTAPVSPPAPATKSETTDPSVRILESDILTHTDTAAAEDENGVPRYKSDFSILHKRMYSYEISSSNPPKRSLAMLSAAQMAIKLPLPARVIPKEPSQPTAPSSQPANTIPVNTTTQTPAQPPVNPAPAPVLPKETPKPQAPTPSNQPANAMPVNTTKQAPVSPPLNPPADTAAPIVIPPKRADNTDTIKKKQQAKAPDEVPAGIAPVTTGGNINTDTPGRKHLAETIDASPAVRTTSISNSDQPAMKLESKIDTAIERPKESVNMDPLASYKTDSDFVTRGVQIKDIPIEQTKNKPKYLIPVDSVSKIKGDFYLIRARQVLEKGDFKTGDKYLRKSLDLDPTNPQAWMLHADLFLTLGLADQALKEYEISGEIDSTNPKVFYNIALLYVKANNHQKAYKYFSKAIEVSDKYLLAYMGRASLLMDDRDYLGAIQDYDRLLTANKYYSPAFKSRGLAKMEIGKFADAIQDFNQYLEIEDPDGYVIYQRGISKIYSNNLLQGCLDLSSAQELGFKEAEKAIKKFCE